MIYAIYLFSIASISSICQIKNKRGAARFKRNPNTGTTTTHEVRRLCSATDQNMHRYFMRCRHCICLDWCGNVIRMSLEYRLAEVERRLHGCVCVEVGIAHLANAGRGGGVERAACVRDGRLCPFPSPLNRLRPRLLILAYAGWVE